MKKALSVILAVLMMIAVLPLTSFAITSGDWDYEVKDDGTASLTAYYGTASNMVIPSEIDGYTVTEIYKEAFTETTFIKSVSIPNTVTRIGIAAFAYCYALESVTLPNSVKLIDGSSFEGCTSLKSFNLGSGLTKIGNSAFFQCTALTSVTGGSNLKTIGVGAFQECTKLASVTIPSKVATICNYAFYDCLSLSSVTIPASVTTIGKFAFANTAVKKITFNGTLTQWNSITKGQDITPEKTTVVNCTGKTTLKLTNAAAGMTVSWNKVTGATGYTVMRKASGESSYTKLGNTKAVSYTDKTAKTGTSYTYAVRPYSYSDDYGTAIGAYAYATGLRLANPAVTLTNISSGMKVAWAKVAGAKGYTVYRKAAGDSSYTKLGTTTNLLYTDKTVKAGVTYTYAVRAYNGSTTSWFTAKSLIRLTNPAYTLAKASGGIKVTITKVTGAKGYSIYRKTGSGSYSRIATTTSLSYVDKTAKAGTKYTYAVRAYNGSVMSSYAAKTITR